ncbi:MAG: hypothetical protein ACLUKN_02170 [Bacilli bacterium]
MGIPLAWLQLTGERKRFAVAIAGITFAVAMMLFQMGLQSALYKQVVGPLLLLDGEVILVGHHYEYFGWGGVLNTPASGKGGFGYVGAMG